MNKYIFILGNHPKLSTAEIKSLFAFMQIQAVFKSVSIKILLVNTEEQLDCEKIIDKLGGTIKIAKVLEEFTGQYDYKMSIKNIQTKKNRLNFGFSFYEANIKKIDILNILKRIKKALKEKNINTNYVLSKTHELTPSQVFNKLSKDKGIEHIIINTPEINYLAETLAVFNIRKYSFIDYGIPRSNPKKGMLPPKLANILINLSLDDKFNKELIFYDPFCGNGRIVMQSIANGFCVYGSDIDQGSVDDSKENIKWLIDKFDLVNAKYKVFLQDATKPINLEKDLITNLVTEPDLGTAYKYTPNSNEISKSFYTLENKYVESFKNIAKILKNQAKVVIVFPKIDKVSLLDKVVDKFSTLGYHKISEFEYSRDYQIVKRHIGVFVFNKTNN